MKEIKVDAELRTYEKKHDHNWQYLAYKLRKHLDIWATRNIVRPGIQMKQSYFPVIFNISVDGSTASAITKRSMVIKQNMSQTVNELKKMGMIVTRPYSKDKRSEQLDLTPAGKELVLDTHLKLDKLQKAYSELVGEKELKSAVDVLLKIIAFHENQE